MHFFSECGRRMAKAIRQVVLVFLTTLCICGFVMPYRRFQNLIPNGDIVPHSCRRYYIWHGVGHNHFKGAGPLNRFGRDFQNANHVWTDVCHLDSDGDGMTNGQELGDPTCTWKVGDTPERITNITNPGVCDPFDSKACIGRNFFLKCKAEKFDCPATQEEGVKNFTVRFPEIKFSTAGTVYRFIVFEFPQDGDYHLIAIAPYIVNKDVLHHLTVFGCDEYDGNITTPMYTPTYNSGWPICGNTIGGWSLGGKGACRTRDIGHRFGNKKGYKKGLLQIHWNISKENPNQTDSSGVVIYYTPKLRSHDVALIESGEWNINIPPRKERAIVTGKCSSECSRRLMKGPIKIYAVYHHMHYYGKAMKTELFRNGTKIADISNKDIFEYDNNPAVYLEKPVEMFPGDEVKTTCVYSTKYRKNRIHYSQGIDGEMCFNYLYFYPYENAPLGTCISYRQKEICRP